jgi:outer membrane receptor protein involved in Fe transport
LSPDPRSLALDPANASAHRFLSDVYLGMPRSEIARVSELLQAQMLQDININPVQPSLSETNISVVARGGPAAAGFNEFTPLFERNQAQVNATGVVGNNDTLGGEGVVSALYDRYSLSAGAFHFESDGWRANNDVNDDIYNLFAQAAITPELNAQVELRRRETHQGNLAFDFDADQLFPNLRIGLDQDIVRAGLRYSPTPRSDLLMSLIYNNTKGSLTDSIGDEAFTVQSDTEHQSRFQPEIQYLYRRDELNMAAGFVHTRVDIDDFFGFEARDIPGLSGGSDNRGSIDHYRGYAYGNLELPRPVTWTLGLSVDDYEEEDLKVQKVNPKLGVQWNVTDELRLRAAAFRTVKPPLVANRTLEPTQVAGFNQFFDDLNGAESWREGIGVDHRLMDGLYIGGEATWRQLDEPVFVEDDARHEQFNEQTHRAYVFWSPPALQELALSAEFVYDRFEASDEGEFTDDAFGFPEDLETISVPVSAKYFHPSGFFAGVTASYVYQEVKRAPEPDPDEARVLREGHDDFVVVDAAIGYRFPKRFGIATLSVNNLFNTHFNYQDDSFREFTDQPALPPYIPERTIMGRITINF